MEEEYNHQKSVKEQSYISKLFNSLILNVIFLPFLTTLVTMWLVARTSALFGSLVVLSMQEMHGFYLRYLLQMVVLLVLNQSSLDFQRLVEGFEKMVKDNGKTKFDQWFYDISYKSCIAVVVFIFGLFLSVIYPWANVATLILVATQYLFDKYNLLYIYPLEFESQTISRKTLVCNSFLGIILFQLCMILIGFLFDGLLSTRAKIYLLSCVGL